MFICIDFDYLCLLIIADAQHNTVLSGEDVLSSKNALDVSELIFSQLRNAYLKEFKDRANGKALTLSKVKQCFADIGWTLDTCKNTHTVTLHGSDDYVKIFDNKKLCEIFLFNCFIKNSS